jgi:hypothetical protein
MVHQPRLPRRALPASVRRRGARRCCFAFRGDARDDRVHGNGVAFFREDLDDRPCGGQGIRRHFVGGDLGRLVAIDLCRPV